MRVYRIGLTILIALFMVGPAGAEQCRVTIDIPAASEGAMLTLNSVLYEVGSAATWIVYTAKPVIPGSVLIEIVDGPSKQHDYTLENVLGVSYPSGETVLVEWSCELDGEWVDTPGCSCLWVEPIE